MASYIFITGKTTEGVRFRPSDFADRLSGVINVLEEDEYDECKDMIHLTTFSGNRGLLINTELETINPKLYKFFMDFIEKNDLQVESITR